MNTKSENYLNECRAALSSEQTHSLAITANWAHVDKQKVHADWDELYREMVPVIGVLLPSAEPVQALIAEHYRIVSRFYKPSKKAYIGMSLFYGEDQDMMKFHNGYHRNMVPFLAQAISIYAEANL
ncbi:transcriptional regulator [Janthinobacterium svalbardensis]|uniref:Transcriptional regulator n=1 Tax=Janthinobacterium svalbardensis TaxID=368607 RepID=A0A290WSP1_9BURK|nr:TipAS antibiotic-recognition domain-containing protein [Janthinobacterium svalbardensis]ATD59917.1 transcriptional regulator [Janthinobacterium svalbardensis]